MHRERMLTIFPIAVSRCDLCASARVSKLYLSVKLYETHLLGYVTWEICAWERESVS
jgi:hypothetical protein